MVSAYDQGREAAWKYLDEGGSNAPGSIVRPPINPYAVGQARYSWRNGFEQTLAAARFGAPRK